MQLPLTITLYKNPPAPAGSELTDAELEALDETETIDVVAGPADNIALERQYKLKGSGYREDFATEHLTYLAWHALRRQAVRRGTPSRDFPKFDDWINHPFADVDVDIDDEEDLNAGEE